MVTNVSPLPQPTLHEAGIGCQPESAPHVLGQLSQVNIRYKESFTMPEVRLGTSRAILTIDGAEITNVQDLTVSLEKAPKPTPVLGPTTAGAQRSER